MQPTNKTITSDAFARDQQEQLFRTIIREDLGNPDVLTLKLQRRGERVVAQALLGWKNMSVGGTFGTVDPEQEEFGRPGAMTRLVVEITCPACHESRWSRGLRNIRDLAAALSLPPWGQN